jgi:hypothetical protein
VSCLQLVLETWMQPITCGTEVIGTDHKQLWLGVS